MGAKVLLQLLLVWFCGWGGVLGSSTQTGKTGCVDLAECWLGQCVQTVALLGEVTVCAKSGWKWPVLGWVVGWW